MQLQGLTDPMRQPQPAPPKQTDRLEGAFLEQMLKYMGPKAREGAGSGGEGEAQFQSFLTQQYAAIMADRIDLRIERGTP